MNPRVLTDAELRDVARLMESDQVPECHRPSAGPIARAMRSEMRRRESRPSTLRRGRIVWR